MARVPHIKKQADAYHDEEEKKADAMLEQLIQEPSLLSSQTKPTP